MMYKVLIHCTHCSSLTVQQGDPAHRWPLISEVSQSQRFVNLSSFFIFLTLHSLLPFSELERRRGLQPQVQHYPHHQEPCGKVDSRYMLPRDIDKLHCHSSRITEPKPQQNLGMWETWNWKATVSKRGIIFLLSCDIIGDSLELSNLSTYIVCIIFRSI